MSKNTLQIVAGVVVLGIIVLIFLSKNKAQVTEIKQSGTSATGGKTVIPDYKKDYSDIVEVADKQVDQAFPGGVAVLTATLS